jgi:hypothetical protein
MKMLNQVGPRQSLEIQVQKTGEHADEQQKYMAVSMPIHVAAHSWTSSNVFSFMVSPPPRTTPKIPCPEDFAGHTAIAMQNRSKRP